MICEKYLHQLVYNSTKMIKHTFKSTDLLPVLKLVQPLFYYLQINYEKENC